ncbi:hypothetical protein LSAT2_032282 [Lamellibrachia satsuma]|nr:hypothetical protein LSAT2_032282 [Lamellibrachia satsuma]
MALAFCLLALVVMTTLRVDAYPPSRRQMTAKRPSWTLGSPKKVDNEMDTMFWMVPMSSCCSWHTSSSRWRRSQTAMRTSRRTRFASDNKLQRFVDFSPPLFL